MWERTDLKQRAKTVLRKDYWKAFLISLVIGFAAGGGAGGSGGSGFKFNGKDFKFKDLSFTDMDWSVVFPVLIIASFIIAIVFIVSIAIRTFIGYPLEVGGRRYYIKTVEETDNRLCFTFAFQSGNYLKIVVSMLLRDVQLFLWFLLLIIPGIVKSYEYRMVPYILAQNPQIGAKAAIQLSRRMTDGSKGKMFVLDLSFIGWYLLGFLACCVGVLFVQPYVDMTMAELYLDLRTNALNTGICQPGDLAMDPAAVSQPAISGQAAMNQQ